MQVSSDQAATTSDSSDREQTAVRLINCIIVVIYTTICYLSELLSFTVVFIYLLAIPFSAALLLWATRKPETSHARRVIGMLADLGTTTAAMCISGEAASPLFVVYLWTTFGNGFRYGKDYLYLSMCLSILGFSLVLFFSPFWSQQLHLGTGLMLTLSVLPIYIAALLRRLQLATEKAEQASLAKSQFLASMSHELRTPLNGVVGMSDMLSATKMNREQKEFAGTIQSSAKTLLALIENILDFSKIEAGKTELESVDFDLHELIHSVVAILFPQAERNGVECKLHIAADVPYSLEGDSIHLRQVLINLIGNAIKFTEEGSIELNVFTVKFNNDQVRLRFEVIDTGIGMSQEEQELIFENFTQADQSISRRFGGTGLGTTISRRLVELMGGVIGVDSETKVGSKFWFELDYEFRARHTEYVEDEPVISNSTSMLLIGSGGNRKSSIEEHLEDWGFGWDNAENVEAAITKLQHAADTGQPYDIALVDHRCLGYRGNSDILALKIAAEPLARQTNLILISQGDLERSREVTLLSAGYFCILKAPIEKRFLFNALHATSMTQSSGSNVTTLVNFKSGSEKAEKLELLVGEDNTTNQKVIRAILEYAGHTVHICENGNEILDAVESKSYDMVILDMHMPEMDGIETAKALRFIQTGSERRPIIMLTADATVSAIKACEDADIDVYLTKPVESEKLLSSITSLLVADKDKGTGKYRPPAAQKALNLESLKKLSALSDNPDFMADLIGGFTTDTEILVSEIEACIGQKNYSAVQDHAHAIKGSAFNIGATLLATCASEIVNQCQKGEYSNLPKLYTELVSVFDTTTSALNAFLENDGSAAI